MRILVVNSGSSSLKLSVLDQDRLVAADVLGPVGRAAVAGEVERAIKAAEPIDAVGHRIVHGGTGFHGPVRIDAVVRSQIAALGDLAPLHQPKSLAALDLVDRLLPETPAVACFDTAFHSTIPPAAATYALPTEWRNRWPLRRFGFHGLSNAYVSFRAAEMVGRPVTDLRIVSCHLGAGASVTAIGGGRSVDTTMGFTPLEGLVMATRSGTVDPGLVLWLEQHGGLDAAEIADALEHRSGLAGLAGTDDMQQVLEGVAAGEPGPQLALEVYLHRLAGAIGAMAVSLGGLDVLVFTGGVGENAAPVRWSAAHRLRFLGVALDRQANDNAVGDQELTAGAASVRTLVITAREDLQIAAEVLQVLGTAAG